MKKLLIAFSMIGAGALIACAEEAGSQSNSVTTNYASQTWFSASASGSNISTNGGVFSSEVTVANGRIEFDSDIEEPVSFAVGNILTTKLAQVTFELEASVVPVSALPENTELEGAKTAFALVEAEGKTATNFQAWVTAGWLTLDGLTPIPEVGEPYDLTMKFDDSVAGSKKVQFTVVMEKPTGNVVTNESDWLEYAGLSTNAATRIDFVGCGKLKSMNADQVWVVSSEVIIEGGKVTIAEKDMGAMKALVLPGKTIEEVLTNGVKNVVTAGKAISENCPLSVAEAYAVGLIANEGGTMTAKDDGTFKVKADAQAKVDDGNIAVGFVTPLTPNDTSAEVTYTLKGSANGTTYYEIEGMVGKTNINDIKIPTSAITGDDKYRYFKVVTTVTLAQ